MEIKEPSISIRRIQRYIYEGKEYESYNEVVRVIHLGWIRELLEQKLIKEERIDETRICELLLDHHEAVERLLERDIRLETEK